MSDAQDKLTSLEVMRREAKRRADEQERSALRVPQLIGYSLEELLRRKFPERRVLLTRGNHVWIRAGNIWQVFAYRGTGKTWVLETIALVVAYGIEALGLRAPDVSRVLYVDGEMLSEDVQTRFKILADVLKVPRQLGLLAKSNLTLVGADWQEEYLPHVDRPEGQAALEPFVEQADLIILDGRSSMFDPEGEKDPTAWQPAQDWILSLRKRGKAVMMAHQSNRQGGARGHGKAEDAIDVNLKLSRPEGYTADQGARFLVEFDKARGIRGEAAEPFIATLVDTEGWRVERPGDRTEADTRDEDDRLELAILARLQKQQVTNKEDLAMLLGRDAKPVRLGLGRLMSADPPQVTQARTRQPFVVTPAGLARMESPGLDDEGGE